MSGSCDVTDGVGIAAYTGEIAFVILGVIPYWVTIWMKEKTAAYWAVLSWACLVYIAYYTWHSAPGGVLSTSVELGIAIWGSVRIARNTTACSSRATAGRN